MRTLKDFLEDSAKHKTRVHQLGFIGAFFQEKSRNRVFVKVDSRSGDYFPEYSNYVGIDFEIIERPVTYPGVTYGPVTY